MVGSSLLGIRSFKGSEFDIDKPQRLGLETFGDGDQRKMMLQHWMNDEYWTKAREKTRERPGQPILTYML